MYLDSSDFSVLAEARALTIPWQSQLRKYLLDCVASGRVEIRVSSVHVSEAAPHSKDVADWAKRRADLIEMLSRGKAIRYFDEVDRGDLAVAFKIPGYEFPFHAHDDNGAWWPDVSDVAVDVQDTLIRALREVIAAMPRPQRRELERRFFSGRGELSSAGKQFFRANSPESFLSLSKEFPLSEGFVQAWIEVFDRPSAAAMLVAELRRVLQNVRVFMEWFCAHGKAGVFSACLRTPIQESRPVIERLRDLYGEALRLQEKLDLPRGEAFRRIAAMADENCGLMKRSLAERALSEHSDWLVAHGVDATAIRNVSAGELVLPKIEALSDLMREWFLLNVTSNRKVLDSDFGDIAHLCHAPYVDVIRCDGFAWNVSRLVRSKWPNVAFVSRLEDLKDAIDERHKFLASG